MSDTHNPVSSTAGVKKRLLLIEKSRTLRHVLARVFRGSEFICDVVESFSFAMNRLQSSESIATPYDGVVLGWPSSVQQMSDEFLDLLRQPRFNGMFVLILSHDVNPAGRAWVSTRPNTGYVMWKNYGEIISTLIQATAGKRQSSAVNESRAQSPDTPAPQKPVFEGSGSTKILIVDDSPSSRIFFKRLLEARGYLVEAASTVEDAIETLKRNSFDLAILDYYMPEMTGESLCRRIKDDSSFGEITCAILTSSFSDHIIQGCLDAGAVECIFKHEAGELISAKVDAITRSLKGSRRQHARESMLENVLSAVSDAVFGVSKDGLITYINQTARDILGYESSDELLGESAHQHIHYAYAGGIPVDIGDCFLSQAYHNMTKVAPVDMVFWNRQGEEVEVRATAFPLRVQERDRGIIVSFRELKKAESFEDQLWWHATRDEATKLTNKRYFEVQLENELQRIKRSKSHAALIYLQVELAVDEVTAVRPLSWNQLDGERAKKSLEQIARMLMGRIRSSDLAAHLGEGHFSGILRDIDTRYLVQLKKSFNDFANMVQRLLASHQLKCRVSTGIALVDDRAKSSIEVIARARYAQQLARGRIMAGVREKGFGSAGDLPENVKPLLASGSHSGNMAS